MALATMGTLDLSVITDQLRQRLQDCFDSSPLWDTIAKFTIHIDGAMPEAGRALGDTVLSLYLFHVGQDRFQLNSPVIPAAKPVAQRIPYQPLALDLMYLLTAFADQNYVNEQRAMSIALRCFHDSPIVRGTIPVGGALVAEEYTLTMEPQSADELARLWQSFAAPFRLSAVYKASVVFITPGAPDGEPAPPPKRVLLPALSADPLPFLDGGQLTGTLSTATFYSPDSTLAAPRPNTVDYAPAIVAAGDQLQLLGANLTSPTASRTYLIDAGGSVVDISPWVDPNPGRSTDVRRLLILPLAQGAAPAGTPPAGVYRIRVGDATGPLSNSSVFNIAARVDPAPNPPLLAAAAGVYTLPGGGFAPGQTQLLLGTASLNVAGGLAPGPGEFSVAAASIAFVPPPGLVGLIPVRIRVRSAGPPPAWVESPPQWAVSL